MKRESKETFLASGGGGFKAGRREAGEKRDRGEKWALLLSTDAQIKKRSAVPSDVVEVVS